MSLNRRQFLASSSVAFVASALDWRSLLARGAHGAPALQPDLLVPVRRSIGTFIGQGGTIGWHIDAKSVVVVDSQFPATAKTCLDAVNARTGSRRLDYLVNTHHHADHTGGNPVFRPVARKILAQANVPRLQLEAAARARRPPRRARPASRRNPSRWWPTRRSTRRGERRWATRSWRSSTTGRPIPAATRS